MAFLIQNETTLCEYNMYKTPCTFNRNVSSIQAFLSSKKRTSIKKCRGNFYFKTFVGFLRLHTLRKWAWHLKLNGSHLLWAMKLKNFLCYVLCQSGELPWNHLFFINSPHFYCTKHRIDSQFYGIHSLSVYFYGLSFFFQQPLKVDFNSIFAVFIVVNKKKFNWKLHKDNGNVC